MRTKYEINRENAKKLSQMILGNPNTRVIAWIYSEGISDDYCFWGGNLGTPQIQIIAYSKANEHYIKKGGNVYEDCSAYYGSVADDWDDNTLEEKAIAIPWERVIAVSVSVV